METPNEINNIHDALKKLTHQTDALLDKHNEGEKINIAAEAQISKRFDTISRQASLLIQYRKEVGSKKPIWFFEKS